MKIEISTDKLDRLLGIVSSALEQKPLTDTTKGILLEAEDGKLTATATSSDVSMRASESCAVTESGKMLLNGSLLCNIAKKLPNGQVKIGDTDGGKNVTIKAGSSKTKLAMLDANDYPEFDCDIKQAGRVVMSAAKLANMLSGVQYAVSKNDSRAVLRGAFMQIGDNKAEITGLDGFRLALCNTLCETEGSAKMILPEKAYSILIRIYGRLGGDVEITTDGHYAVMKCQDCEAKTALIAGEYLEYDKIIPKESKIAIQVNANEMRSAVDRLSLLRGRVNVIKMQVADGSISLTANNEIADGQEWLDAQVNGGDITIAFNGQYIQDFLHAINDENIVMKMNAAVQPVVITGTEDTSYLHLCLPVRLNG